jgi:transcriptional regulator with XRE-family HTH domain
MGSIQREFGRRVRILREQQLLTIEELADRAEIDPAHLGLVERGQRNVTLKTIDRIACGLSLPLRELFAGVK